MNSKVDKLAQALALKLKAYDREIGNADARSPARPKGPGSRSKSHKGRRRSGTIGSRGDQYSLLKELYTLVVHDERFPQLHGRMGSEKHKRRLDELLKIVRDAFREAYGDDHRSYRQRATTWAAVLHEAWDESISPSRMEVFILRRGGIQSIYVDCSMMRRGSE